MADLITKQKAEPKLSKRRPGHWRNKWFSNKWREGGGGEIISEFQWPSREIAEEMAIKQMRDPHHAYWEKKFGLRYLGPVFFPEDSDG